MSNGHFKSATRLLPLIALVAGLAACGDTTTDADTKGGEGGSGLSGSIAIDGSSTVYPVSEAMAEEFGKKNADVKVTVGQSGTGGGFKKFCAGETDISDASRPVKDKEAALCKEKNIEFIELPVAYDALSVVINKDNDWAKCLTTDELKKIWEPGAKDTIKSWKQVRDAFPDEPFELFGPGNDSGTFDYFTKAINGEEKASRTDFTASEDDNVLVQGVSGGKGAMGYFGYAYYAENKGTIQAVEVDGGNGCVAPSAETVLDGTYKPLSRPIFIYVKKAAMERPEVKAFVEFYLDAANKELVTSVGYVNLPEDIYTVAQDRLKNQTTGSDIDGLFKKS